jgi:3-oxoacyl-[acyl-carrier-protein] synthase-1
MIVRISDNIISSLGFTTEENYTALLSGRSGIRLCESYKGIPEAFFASFIERERLDEQFAALGVSPSAYTPLERAALLSVSDAADRACLDLSDPSVLFVFSSTKGNVHLLDEAESSGFSRAHRYLWHTARLVAGYFHNPNNPLVVSNACISGACAQIAALRELSTGAYRYAVVCGVDMLSRFIISGFQSFKALSPAPCRPFDAARSGLTLGEAAATVIYRPACADDMNDAGAVFLQEGAIRNDANHISGPSRTGEGCYLAMQAALKGLAPEDLAFINAHGTATAYNDRMESIAITRAGLQTVPVNSLKGAFGHTLGAAGVLESVLSIRALAGETLLPTCGFRRADAEYPLLISERAGQTKKAYCLKTLSGFGGCNAALLFKRNKKTS